MSWLFSQALVAEYSQATCWDGAPSAPSSGSPTPLAYLPPDKTTAFSRLSRSGMTFKPLTEDLGKAVLTWYLEDSRARTSALPAKAPESTGPAVECGDTWRGSLAKFDLATSSWRTAQPSLLEDLGESSVTWPRSGMTAGGLCWELPMSGRRISGTGSGLWLGTPTATMSVRSEPFRRGAAPTPAEFVKWPTPTASRGRSEGSLMQYRALVDAGVMTKEEAEAMCQGSLTPPRMKAWPTPMAADSRGSSGRPVPGKQVQLVDAVRRVATPTARDWKSGKASQATMERNSRPLSKQIGGSLNPTWVEWLMGWPIGWTDLKP
jgi:hypothetical protein